jgi:hypothetical protein
MTPNEAFKAMNKFCRFVLASLMALSSVFAHAQNAVDTAKLNFIKMQFTGINKNLKSYKRIAKTDTIETTEGNEVLLYYKGNEIKKIAATYYRESGKALEEYYFSGSQLIFCYCIDSHYNKPFNVKGGGKIASTSEERIYLNNGKIFLVKKKPDVPEYFSEVLVDPQKAMKRFISLK